MYLALAKSEGTRQFQVKSEMPPDWAAAAILRDPSSHNVKSMTGYANLRAEKASTPISLSLAGGNFKVKNLGDLLNIYDQTTPLIKTALPETRRLKKERKQLEDLRRKLTREIDALRSGRSTKAADSSILGKWRLATGNNNSVVEVIRNKKTGSYSGVLRVNRLEFFRQNDTVFVVKPVKGQPNNFVGTEYGYTNSRLPKTSSLRIKISNNKMTYSTSGEILSWIKQSPAIDWRQRRQPLVKQEIDFNQLSDF